MDAAGIDSKGNINPVIYYDWNLVAITQCLRFLGNLEELGAAYSQILLLIERKITNLGCIRDLFPNLNYRDATDEGLDG
jgi:hypothetical protein